VFITSFIKQKKYWSWTLILERVFISTVLFRGCWYVHRDTMLVVDHSPISNIVDLINAHS